MTTVRLPVPGNDNGTWGDVLNEFLRVAHNEDGTLKNTSLVVGDIKSGMQATDHSGWVKLNGRALSSLTATQQAAAATLGLTGTLPDAGNSFLVQNGTTLGSISGSNNRTLSQAHLPNVNLTGTTDLAGSHSHLYSAAASSGGGSYPVMGAPSYLDYSQTQTTSTEPSHTHTFSTSSLNGNVTQTSLNIAPLSLSVNMFIYLGS